MRILIPSSLLLTLLTLLNSTSALGDTVIRPDDTVIEVPQHHQVLIIPNGFNACEYSGKNNHRGMRDGRWPQWDHLCEQYIDKGLEFSPQDSEYEPPIYRWPHWRFPQGWDWRFIGACQWAWENL